MRTDVDRRPHDTRIAVEVGWDRLGQVEVRIDALSAQREAASEDVSPTARTTFMRVAERHDGEALASVVKLHPKRDEYSCSGCNLMVTLEVVNLLATRDDLQICKACGRILYVAGASHAAPS